MIARLSVPTAKKIIKILKKNGFALDRIKGSHHYFSKSGSSTICVPVHGAKDIPAGTFKQIRKLSGLSYEDFL